MNSSQLSSPVSSSPKAIIIRGGKPLDGEVTVRGAKNSVSKMLVAALLTKSPSLLRNVPDIEEMRIVTSMLHALGGEVVRKQPGDVTILTEHAHPASMEILLPFSGKNRIPILLAGPLLARFGKAYIPHVGGDAIGPRPIDYHLHVLESFGASIEKKEEGYILTAPKLHGGTIELAYPSVGATEQALLASVLAEGVTHIANAAMEPEVLDLVAVLQKMGAIISIDTDRHIHVLGVPSLHGFEHTPIPDRMEAASWASAALATRGRIFVRGARQQDMMTFLNTLRRVGGDFRVEEDGITFWRKNDTLTSLALETDVHPGFMTDWQQPFMIALTQAHGVSILHETVYENRFGYVEALNAMGAHIQLYRECLGGKACRFEQKNYLHSAVVVGPTKLHGASIHVPDIRAGFSYVIAALAAEGESHLTGMHHLHRGYENLLGKLQALQADLRVENG